ncbi:hypothetical protein NE237_001145 [Protea cynaroides]|uniref:NAD(P)H dehydrogenase (quinone) n=1 Tax=Protea cynaroides TaxID=273540 RepID=A0A9Q0KSZ0_9MAGN|nr:hypothetical protein NE237_001145 [Protea cynaroides]
MSSWQQHINFIDSEITEPFRESKTDLLHFSMATKVFIVYYSMYGHVAKLAEEIKKGAESVEGIEAKLYQVPETLPSDVLGKLGAPPQSDVAIIEPSELAEADGLIFGFPTRFGMMAAQFKAFMDATGSLWQTQKLAGKPAGIFYSTGSQGGGQETTPLTAITQLVHHGMIFVPVGYTAGAGMFEMEQVKGGTPYGAGTFAGDGSRQPTKLELELAFHQGKHFAGIAKKLKTAASIRFVKSAEVCKLSLNNCHNCSVKETHRFGSSE